ncbi:MAG: 1,2-phenylacetyl-CoA epoxidase subunit PaaC [Actinomycetales bacterium]
MSDDRPASGSEGFPNDAAPPPAVAVEPAVLARYALRLGDDALVLSQRLGEWISRAPQIEGDVALANLALDLLGQARILLTYAGQLQGKAGGPERTEDQLAYQRTEREFTNVQLVEQPNGDFGVTMARQLVFATYQLALYEALRDSTDETLAGMAAKAVKEVAYHRDHAMQWVLRLGDGTDVSRERMQAGLDVVWPFVAELFTDDDVDRAVAAAGVGVLPSSLQQECTSYWRTVLAEATLDVPAPSWTARGGRAGIHSEHLGRLLGEMQSIARQHPDAQW